MRYGFIVLLALTFIWSCGRKTEVAWIEVENPLHQNWEDAFVDIDVHKIFPEENTNKKQIFRISEKNQVIPYQILSNGKIGISLDFMPSEQKRIKIEKGMKVAPSFIKRSHAELSIRQDGTFDGQKWSGGYFKTVDHLDETYKQLSQKGWLRYEGPGWESDKIGYRLYLDERNAMDIFGKLTHKMILPFVGHDTSSSYHEMNWWGMDILKVGETFGAGTFALHDLSPGTFSELLEQNTSSDIPFYMPKQVDHVVYNLIGDGPIRSGFEILYKGWNLGNHKVDIRARHYIAAGSYLTKHEIEVVKGQAGLVIGIIQPENAIHYQITTNPLIDMVYGIPALSGDSLAVLLVINEENVPFIQVNQQGSRLYFLDPGIKKVTFWSGALWQRNFVNQSFKDVCFKYARKIKQKANNPLQIMYKRNQQ